ncbi:hypothetical protein TGARI_320080 [Toxoplasma gondii ARI]|uniref:KH domain protein n=1 Tax=Toxoplasma gondii ARI TaxID=1074872 RepID=A0A139XKQ6_TOXGO|nr:hypothetical protein TGARI_320080 [Toxoplasma gondii ARI]
MGRSPKAPASLSSLSPLSLPPTSSEQPVENARPASGAMNETQAHAADAASGEVAKEDKPGQSPSVSGALGGASSTSFSSDLHALVKEPLVTAPSLASSASGSFSTEVGRDLENAGSMSTAGSFKEQTQNDSGAEETQQIAFNGVLNGDDPLPSSLFFSTLSFSMSPTLPEDPAPHRLHEEGLTELTHPGKDEKDNCGTATSTVSGVAPRRTRQAVPGCVQVVASSCLQSGSCSGPLGPREGRNSSRPFLSSLSTGERILSADVHSSQSLPSLSVLTKAFSGPTVAVASKGGKEKAILGTSVGVSVGTGNSSTVQASVATSLCVCKFLLGEDVAGYLVGRKGGGIDEFQKRNGPGLRVTVSKRGEIFPVLGERIAAAVGVQESIARALDEIVDVATKRAMHKEEERRLDTGRKISKPKTCFKLVVPETSVRLLEQQVENRESAKDIGRKHKTEVLITSANDWFHLEAGDAVAKERLVQVIGLPNDVKDTVRELVPLYQQDTTLTTSLELCYGKKTPAPPPPPPPVLPSLFTFTPSAPPPAFSASSAFLPPYSGSCFAVANPLLSDVGSRLLAGPASPGGRGPASLSASQNALAPEPFASVAGLGKTSFASSRSGAFASGLGKAKLLAPLLSTGLNHAPAASTFSTAVGSSLDGCPLLAPSQGLSVGRSAETELPDVFVRTLNAAAPLAGQSGGVGVGKSVGDANVTGDLLSLLNSQGGNGRKLFSEGHGYLAYVQADNQAGVSIGGGGRNACAASAVEASPEAQTGGAKPVPFGPRKNAGAYPPEALGSSAALSQAYAVRALLHFMGNEAKQSGREKREGGPGTGRNPQKRETFEVPTFLGATGLRDDLRLLSSRPAHPGLATQAGHRSGPGSPLNAPSGAGRGPGDPSAMETGTGSEAATAFAYSLKRDSRDSRGPLLSVDPFQGSGMRSNFTGSGAGSGALDAVGFLSECGAARDGRGFVWPLSDERPGEATPAAIFPGASGEKKSPPVAGAGVLPASSRLVPSAPIFHPQQPSGEGFPLMPDDNNLQLLNSLLQANLGQRGGAAARQGGERGDGSPGHGARTGVSPFLPSGTYSLAASSFSTATPLAKQRMRDAQWPPQRLSNTGLGADALDGDAQSTRLRNELLCLLRRKELREGAEFQPGRGDASARGSFCLPSAATRRGSHATAAGPAGDPGTTGRDNVGGKPETADLEVELALLQSILSQSQSLPSGTAGGSLGRAQGFAACADAGLDQRASSGLHVDLQKLQQLQGRVFGTSAVKRVGRADEDSGIWREGQRLLRGPSRGKNERDGGQKREDESTEPGRLPFSGSLSLSQSGPALSVFAASSSHATTGQPQAPRLVPGVEAWPAHGSAASSPCAATSSFAGGFGLVRESQKDLAGAGRGDGATGPLLPGWPVDAEERSLASSAVPRTSASTPTHRRSKGNYMQSLGLAFQAEVGEDMRGDFRGERRWDGVVASSECSRGEDFGPEGRVVPLESAGTDAGGQRRALSAQGTEKSASLDKQLDSGSEILHAGRGRAGPAPFDTMDPDSSAGEATKTTTVISSSFVDKGQGVPEPEHRGGLRGVANEEGQELTGTGPDEFSVHIQIPVSVAQSESNLSVLLLLLRSLSTRVSAVRPPAAQPGSGRGTHAGTSGAENESAPGTISLQVSGTADNVASASALLQSLLNGAV